MVRSELVVALLGDEVEEIGFAIYPSRPGRTIRWPIQKPPLITHAMRDARNALAVWPPLSVFADYVGERGGHGWNSVTADLRGAPASTEDPIM